MTPNHTPHLTALTIAAAIGAHVAVAGEGRGVKPRHTVLKKTAYLVLAFLGSAFFQFLILYRTKREIAVNRITGVNQPSSAYYVLNIALAGAALLLMLPILRRGKWWQRLFAGVFCLYPLIVLAVTGNGAVRLLLE